MVGAGAAGTAAAWSLSRHPERFQVEVHGRSHEGSFVSRSSKVWEKEATAGGVATSFDLPDGRFINDGVQGGSPAYRNTLMLLKAHALATAPVKFTVSFGQGDVCWGNTFESDVTRRLESDVRRFGKVLSWVSRFEPLFLFIPIKLLLKVLSFSAEFRNLMVRSNAVYNIVRALSLSLYLSDHYKLPRSFPSLHCSSELAIRHQTSPLPS